jgi:membrane protease YdiL (CAAX protease family)
MSFQTAHFRESSTGSIFVVFAASVASAVIFRFFPGAVPIVVTWVFAVGLGVFFIGGQKPFNLGMDAHSILPAVLFGALYWLLRQALEILLLLQAGKSLALDQQLTAGNTQAFLGPLLDQLLVFALAEEIIFRGFLLPQVYLRLVGRMKKESALLLAALMVHVYFGLMHWPHRLASGMPPAEIPFTLFTTGAFGLIYCWVYLRTGNLISAVFIHALTNFPTLLYTGIEMPWLLRSFLEAVLVWALTETWVFTTRLVGEARSQSTY